MKGMNKILAILMALVLLPLSVFSSQEIFENEQFVDVQNNEYNYYIINYNSANIAESQEILQNELIIEGYVFEHKYIVYASEEELDELLNRGIIEEYQSYYNVVERNILPYEDSGYFRVHLFDSADKEFVLENIRSYDDSTTSEDSAIKVFDENVLEDISKIKGVEFISGEPKFEVFNDKANTVSGTKDVRNSLGLYGKGQIIAVADTGLDTGKNDPSMHDDFEGRRIISLTFLGGRINFPYDKNGHGPYVAGSVLGNGIKSGSDPSKHKYDGSYAGAAPEAKLVFQAIGDEQGTGRVYPPWPIDSKLFLPTYQLGARVHSNSWGDIGSIFWGDYGTDCADIDKFINQYKDMNILFAAGNDGYYGYGTVNSPSTAKNVISVGSVDTYNIKKLSRDSSKGYTLDGRIKPDVVAPGNPIISTKSSLTGSCSYPGLGPSYCKYSGTSASTPHVAGITALIREYYIKEMLHTNPSAALVKATLLNGGEQVNSTLPIPSKEAGWGRVNISRSLPEVTQDLSFLDSRQGLKTGKEDELYVKIAKGKPLRVTLVWNDVEGGDFFNQKNPKLVNDLDLVVYDPNGKQYNGNDFKDPYNDERDKLNNVERVEIKDPEAGTYKIEVKGYDVPQGPQDFAVVASYKDGRMKIIATAVVMPIFKG